MPILNKFFICFCVKILNIKFSIRKIPIVSANVYNSQKSRQILPSSELGKGLLLPKWHAEIPHYFVQTNKLSNYFFFSNI